MSNYFKFFPKVVYNGKSVVDITRRVKVLEDLDRDPYAFLPYTIKEDDRPEDIAYYYYGNVNKVWIVYLANNIIDPYTQWPMSNDNFDKTIVKKYKDRANALGYTTDIQIINWTQNANLTNNIVYYVSNDGEVMVTPDTYQLDATLIASEWTPVRIYEHEMAENESRRTIYLISNAYAEQLERDLESIMNGNE